MKTSRSLFLVALTLILAGIAAFVLQPVLDPKPDSVCAKPGAPYSGFVDSDKKDCNITDASYEAISDWESSPKPFRIAGLVLIIAGIVVGAVAIVRSRRDGTPPLAP